jgi:hypothetical protein
MQVSSILSWATAIGLTIFRLSPLQNTPLIITSNLLQNINFLFVNMANLPQLVDYEHEIFCPASLNQLDVLSFLPFPLFYSFVHFPNLQFIFK